MKKLMISLLVFCFVTVFSNATTLTWEKNDQNITVNNLMAIDYNGSLYVAAGQYGTILTSSDAVTWSAQSSGTSNDDIFAVTHNESVFVAVGSVGLILTSSDGISWSSRTSNTNETLLDVIYANNIFVAVGQGGAIVTSTDGITWTARTTGEVYSLKSITYNNGTFFTPSGFEILYSNDGISWTKSTNQSFDMYDIHYVETELFVGVLHGTSIYTSADGLTWQFNSTGQTSIGYDAITSNSTNIVAVGEIYSSYAGLITVFNKDNTWTNYEDEVFSNTALNDAIFDGSKFIVVGDGGAIVVSVGANDTATNTPTSNSINIINGWQLLGATENLDVSKFNNSCVDHIWRYEDGSWQLHIANGQSYTIPSGVTTNVSLDQGDGFWVKGNGACEVNATSSITFNGKTYSTVTSPHTGKIWLDRNLGASKVCDISRDDSSFSNNSEYVASEQECFGGYYQWGRLTDGHQLSTSTTMESLSSVLQNVGSEFIIDSGGDWTTLDSNGSIRSETWSRIDGTGICPIGFRVPTIDELKAETLDIGVANRDDAFNSFLKLPSAGHRLGALGTFDQGSYPVVLSSTPDGVYAKNVHFYQTSADESGHYRSYGKSVRCIKE